LKFGALSFFQFAGSNLDFDVKFGLSDVKKILSVKKLEIY
jgi:hypothetical protein